MPSKRVNDCLLNLEDATIEQETSFADWRQFGCLTVAEVEVSANNAKVPVPTPRFLSNFSQLLERTQHFLVYSVMADAFSNLCRDKREGAGL